MKAYDVADVVLLLFRLLIAVEDLVTTFSDRK